MNYTALRTKGYLHQPVVTLENGFSLTELMVVLVIVGVLVLLALPKLMPVVTKAKTTEAKLQLKQVYMLQQTYRFEHDRYSSALNEIGFEQEKLVTEGGQARYRIEIVSSEVGKFEARATALVDFDQGIGIHEVRGLRLSRVADSLSSIPSTRS